MGRIQGTLIQPTIRDTDLHLDTIQRLDTTSHLHTSHLHTNRHRTNRRHTSHRCTKCHHINLLHIKRHHTQHHTQHHTSHQAKRRHSHQLQDLHHRGIIRRKHTQRHRQLHHRPLAEMKISGGQLTIPKTGADPEKGTREDERTRQRGERAPKTVGTIERRKGEKEEKGQRETKASMRVRVIARTGERLSRRSKQEAAEKQRRDAQRVEPEHLLPAPRLEAEPSP
mmetsp:Transcript_87233/g.159374  ORF Transcript_87233/g.159374 Transcript_87233/m.159374 type:complete len:225 (-) Transcript_87233:525-1199(-)